MIKNSFIWLLAISIGISTTMYGQQADTPYMCYVKQLKKALKLVGYGTVAATGAGLVALAGGTTLGRCFGDPRNKSILDNERKQTEGFKKLTKNLHYYATPDDDQQQNSKGDGALFVGIPAVAALGAGMMWWGAQGAKKTIYGQTDEEKQTEKEQNEKIKETIKETGKTAVDLTKRLARLTGYSLATAFGTVSFVVSIWYWSKVMMKDKGTICEKLKKQWNKEPDKVYGYVAINPVGIGAIMFGLYGLMKEYRSWQESQARQNIVNAAQTVTSTVGQTVNTAVNAILADSDKKDEMPCDQKLEPKLMVDTATQTDMV